MRKMLFCLATFSLVAMVEAIPAAAAKIDAGLSRLQTGDAVLVAQKKKKKRSSGATREQKEQIKQMVPPEYHQHLPRSVK